MRVAERTETKAASRFGFGTLARARGRIEFKSIASTKIPNEGAEYQNYESMPIHCRSVAVASNDAI